MSPTLTVDARSDAELVEAARRSEPGAFGELFRRWYDRSYDVALNIVRDRESAADVAQDAFLVGWERLMDLRDPDAFGGWILRTTRNRALNRVTRDKYRTMEPIEAHQEGPVAPDPEVDPALHAERSDQRRLIWTAVAVLGERDTSLLDLHLRHGLEPAEIAEELRITPNNASQLLFRLRRKLREAIGAVLLWRDGHPSCANLASVLAGAGAFDTKVAATIRRHQRDCNECLREISRQTNPERLFATVPIAAAPLLLKERAAAALTQAGIPLASPSTAGPPVTPTPETGRIVGVAGGAVAVITAVAAIIWWPSGPGDSSSIREDPGSVPPAIVATAGSPSTTTTSPAATQASSPASAPVPTAVPTPDSTSDDVASSSDPATTPVTDRDSEDGKGGRTPKKTPVTSTPPTHSRPTTPAGPGWSGGDRPPVPGRPAEHGGGGPDACGGVHYRSYWFWNWWCNPYPWWGKGPGCPLH